MLNIGKREVIIQVLDTLAICYLEYMVQSTLRPSIVNA